MTALKRQISKRRGFLSLVIALAMVFSVVATASAASVGTSGTSRSGWELVGPMSVQGRATTPSVTVNVSTPCTVYVQILNGSGASVSTGSLNITSANTNRSFSLPVVTQGNYTAKCHFSKTGVNYSITVNY